jgi:ABC-type uncharacterized transport system auxiliary subunit
MKKRAILLLLWGFCLLWLGGCFAEVPLLHYYTFQPIVSEIAETPGSKFPYVLGVEPYEADVPYQQDKIVFRTSAYEVNFYEYHRWLRPPVELVTEQVQKLFASSGLFRRVHADTLELYSDYILRGKILMFDQWYHGETASAQVGIAYRLIDPTQEKLIWTNVIETTVTMPNLEILETIQGFEAALQNNVQQAIIAIDKVLSQKE